MSQTPPTLARLSAMNERARTTLRIGKRTVMFGMAWLLSSELVAPVLGVEVVNPVEVAQAMFGPTTPSHPAGAGIGMPLTPSMVADAMLPSVQSIIELTLGMSIWMFGAMAALSGVATIGAALWYVAGRFTGPSAASDTGGEA
jgi:hypothetical protein